MRQKKKKKKDPDPQEEEDASSSSPLEEKGLGLIRSAKMEPNRAKCSGRLGRNTEAAPRSIRSINGAVLWPRMYNLFFNGFQVK